MSARLMWNGYGKAAVRVVKVDRSGPRHDLSDMSVEIQLQGAFEKAHLSGDNCEVLPTDTMKNAVYALARQGPVAPPEEFGLRLGHYFLQACPVAHRAVVSLATQRWERLSVDNQAHPHAFLRGTEERRLAQVSVDRQGVTVESGLEGLGLLKTTGSGFAGFLRDKYTTLPETNDRIFATEVSARWVYADLPANYDHAWYPVRTALIETFANHQSASVQQTLYAMGEAALAACEAIREIRLVLPNRHHVLMDLSPFGLDNPDQVYLPSLEPYGRIEAVLARK
jgi:urate oxidase